MTANDDKRIQLIDLVETNKFGTNEGIIHRKEEIKWNNIIKEYEKRLTTMMLEKKPQTNIIQIWQIPEHPYRILLIEGSGSGKTNALLNLIQQEDDDDDYSIIGKIYLFGKGPYKIKHQYFIKQTWKSGPENMKERKAFIELSNNMHDIYKNIEEYNPSRNGVDDDSLWWCDCWYD